MALSRKIGLILASGLLLPLMLSGQVNTGTILGGVADPSGAKIPNAKVTAINEDTGFTRSTETLSDGSYLLPLLPIGPRYRVDVEAKGFKSFSQKGIELQLNQNVRVDAQLVVGSASDSVVVTGQAPLVDTQSAVGGEVVGSERLRELPLNGRNPLQLAGLLPGVTALNTRATITAGNRSANTMSVDGSRVNETDYQLNGVRFAGSYNNSGLNYPNPDALSEFKLVTNPLSAEYGEYAGAVFTAVTKSGTNNFHGSVFEFLRNNALNAKNYFAQTVPTLKQNQFGVTVGGPIIKNRLFWFGAYQGFRIRQDALSASTPLTADERAGLITSATPVIDPETGSPFPTDSQGRYVIPPSRFSPVTQILLDKYIPAAPAGGVYQATGSSKTDVNQYSGKIDYNINQSNQLYVSGLSDQTNPSNPFLTCCPSFGQSYTGYEGVNQTQTVRVFSVSEIHTFRPNLINEFRFGFSKQEERNKPVDPVSPDSLGIANWNFNYNNDPNPQAPTFVLPGRFELGTEGFGKWREGGRNFQFTDIVSWVKGRHNIRTGVDLYHREHHLDANIGDTGYFIFGGSFTGGNPTAEFLLGKPDTELRIRYLNHPGYRSWSQAFFFQDDWKISSRVTLNLGARYELLHPFTEYRANEESNTVWNPRGPLPFGGGTYLPGGGQSTVLPYAPPGLLFPGDKTAAFPDGIPEALIALDKTLIEPRIGIAWDPWGTGKTSVRASVGLFSNAQFVDLPAQVSQNLPFLAISTAIQPPHDLTDPYQGLMPFPPATSENLKNDPSFFSPFLPASGYGWDPNFRQPRIATMTLNIQHELVNNLVLEVGYVGRQSRHLAVTRNINAAMKDIPGVIPSVANEAERRLLDGVNFQQINYEQSIGNASYNALQTTLRYRGGHGLSALVAYTWSHSIDTYSTTNVGSLCCQNPLDLGAERASSDFDQRHVLAISTVYDIPDPFKHTQLRPLSHIFGGWELSTIVSARSGLPFTVHTGIDASYTAAGADRPDLVGDPYFHGNRSRTEEIAAYLNPAAFQINTGHFGSLGRNTFRGPGYFNTDAGLFKNFRVKEGMNLQFRSEFFNAFNQTHLNAPISTLVSPSFGRIVSAGDPRLIQFALKFFW